MEWSSVLSLGTLSARLNVSAASDVGNVRAVNEDSFLAGPSSFSLRTGWAATPTATGQAQRSRGSLRPGHQRETSTTSSAVLESISEANAAVRALTPADARDDAIAGTTVTGIGLLESPAGGSANWIAFNVGDSRIYSWQADHLQQITVDHSAVQELVDLGQITRAEADVHPQRNVVTRAMGVDDDPEADVWLIPAARPTTVPPVLGRAHQGTLG
ncbi:MAG: hypothetical protein WDM88_01775 [Galbitalea sp.]